MNEVSRDRRPATARLPERLPRPVRPPRQTRPQGEIRVRPAVAGDAVRCTTISTTYTTSHVWQLDARAEGDDVRMAFRLVRLPRELTLAAELQPPTSAARRSQLWLVAEAAGVPAPPSAPSGPSAAPRSPVVGYLGASFRAGDACAYLQSLAVDPPLRRQGVATRLLTEARRWAAIQGAGRILADVAARNYPALRLLQKSGFTFCGFNDRCYLKDEVAVFLSVEVR